MNNNRRILIIDDNESIHDDFKSILSPQRPGYANLDAIESKLFENTTPAAPAMTFEVDCASQGQEGYAKVIQAATTGRPYAVAFVDVRMPTGWDGIQTVEKIWAEHHEIEVVICTAYSDYTWEQMLDRLGRSDQLLVLKKPFDTIEVMQVAHALTEKWNLAHRLRAYLAGLERPTGEQTGGRQEFNCNVLHELQDSLSHITTCGEQLREKSARALDPDGLDCLNRMHDATRQMTNRINDLLALSRIPPRHRPAVSAGASRPTPNIPSNLELSVAQDSLR